MFAQLQRLDPRAALALRDLVSIRREKTIVLALIVQLIIAGFSSFLIVGIVAVYDAESMGQQHNIGVTGNDIGPIEEVFIDNNAIALQLVDDTDEGIEAVQSGDLDAVIISDRQSDGVLHVEMLVPDNDLQTPVLINEVQTLLEEVERNERSDNANEIQTTVVEYPDANADSSPYYTFTYTILIPLLVFLPVFISGSVAVDSLSEEIEEGTLEILQTAPVTLTDIITAKVLVATILGPAQAAVWILLLYFNNIPILHPLAMMVFVTGLTLGLVVIGIAVALRSPTRQYAQIVYSILLLIVFAGAAILPEHPANTAAKLATGSATMTTFAMTALLLVLGVVGYAGLMYRVNQLDAVSLTK